MPYKWKASLAVKGKGRERATVVERGRERGREKEKENKLYFGTESSEVMQYAESS